MIRRIQTDKQDFGRFVEAVASGLHDLGREGVAEVLIEQNVKAAAMAADRAYFMAGGQNVHEATTREEMTDDNVLNRHQGVSA